MQIGNDCNPITGYLISHPFANGSNVEKYEHRIRAVFSDHIRRQRRRCPSLPIGSFFKMILPSLQDREKILIATGKSAAHPFLEHPPGVTPATRARGSLLQTFAHNKTNETDFRKRMDNQKELHRPLLFYIPSISFFFFF